MVPFIDLKAQYRSIKTEIDAAVLGVLESSQFVLGREVQAFEELFSAYAGCRHAVAVNSGTSALHLAFLTAGLGPGDEVITTPMTFVATVAAIIYTGARPVFVDIDPVTWTLDPERIRGAITPRTKAIVPVHLHGQPADMAPILEIADHHGLVVIEDAAQAHGAEYRSRRLGSLGALGCFSFYPGKNLGAYGEGGAVVTNDPAYAQTLRMYRDWGQEAKYQHVLKGYNFRMDGIQGAVLRVKMAYIEGWTDDRRRHAARYDAALDRLGVVRPSSPAGLRHVYHVYAVRVADRDGVGAALQKDGIHTGIHYPIPVHLQKAYADLGYRAGDFPEAEKAAGEFLSLPLFPEMTAAQVEETVAGLEAALR